MGKRQTRIFQTDISKRTTELIGKEANVLLNNQTTWHGVIEKINGSELIIKDMRLKKHKITVNQIAEITLDRTTDW